MVDFPNLRKLRTFEAVARLESLGRAAVELNRSQPGLTQTLAKLEDEIGVALLQRGHAGSYLTEGGRILYLRTQRLLAQLSVAFTELIGPALVDQQRLGPLLGKITHNHLSCLIALAESGSADAAARIVDVSVQSLTRNVRELEQIIGRRLTRHTAQGPSMTSQAVELARRLRLASTEIEFAREEIAAARGSAHPHVTVGAMPQCATMVLVAAIDEFLRREPAATVKIEQKPYDSLLADLRQGRIDLIFGVLRKPDWVQDVDEEALFSNPYSILVRAHHPLTRRRSIMLEDFADYDWILPRAGTPLRIAFERLFEGASRKPISSIESSAVDLQVAMIANSDRITMMSAQEIRRAADGGAVIALKLPKTVVRGSDGIAMRAGWHPTPGKLLFLDVLRQQGRRVDAAANEIKSRFGQHSRPRRSVKRPAVFT